MTANPHRVVLDRAVQSFLESFDGRDGCDTGAIDRDVALRGGFTGLDVDEQVTVVDAGVFGSVRVRIVRPTGSAAQLPTVIYLIGGAAAPGRCAHARLIADLSRSSAVAVVVPEYRERHRTAAEQAYATTRWACSHGSAWGLDPSRIAVAGDSSGAAVAIGTVSLSLRRREFGFSQLIAFTPITDTAWDAQSLRRFGEGYFLRGDDLRRWRDRYLADDGRRGGAIVGPLRIHEAEWAGFPASLIITAEADVVRDQGERFAARLRGAGVPTTAVRYEGTIHGFAALEALRDSTASRAAVAQAASALRSTLHVRPPPVGRLRT